MNVIKRDGTPVPLNLDKVHKMVELACEGLTGVSESQVEMNANIQFFDGIKTKEIQEILIRSASDLIDMDSPNYQYVAARLLLFDVRKQVFPEWADEIGYPHLQDHVQRCVDAGVYDGDILNKYSPVEWDCLNSYIDHERCMGFTYAGLRQIVDKYLVQDRSTGILYETPQYMYIMVAATLFQDYPKNSRLEYVQRYYTATSKGKINLPTPVLAGVRTPMRQFASCVLVDVDDTLDGIFSSDMALVNTSHKGGIGINAGRIRGINSKIRGGEVQHTGVVPFLKKFEATVRCCTQNGIRGGSATVHFPIWHQEIEDILVLKNNKGTEDNRVRKLDYSIQISKLFYERFIQGETISLFSPHDVPGLYDAFGTDEFDALYTKYEQDEKIARRTVSANQIILSLLKERAETGRIYIMNIDHCNTHSSFKDKVSMSNLCQEITLPTDPISHIDDEGGEIALCILSAINVGKLRNLNEMEELCDLAVRGLEELIDYQKYPVKAAERSTLARRSLGIGYIGLAHYLAKNGYKYDDQGAYDIVHQLTESFQFNLLKASNALAMEKGPCDGFQHTKYADGILPIDTYKSEVDEITNVDLAYDWSSLRDSIKQYGLRHSTLSAQMPSESSSVVSNATNGIEPPRDYLSIKKSKKGPLKQIVPGFPYLKNKYTLLWDMPSNEGYIKIVAVMQKFFDQAISGNWSYNPGNYENNEVPSSVMAMDLLTTYKYGWKTSYYHNTYDNKKDGEEEPTVQLTQSVDQLVNELLEAEEDCDSCKV
ncbi:MAG: ribonucleoside-diphosphate reductase subunit alpha [Caudoviricetes sp.]|nr:MAG: ribonucleoside-diphosphate reductase subunit alpha [Caudoviricetes sp.]